MQLSILPTGYFKLDGGAMFGVVPKTLWQKLNPPDENNLCTWSMQCLLVQTETRNILIDTGIGNKQDAKWRSFFHPHGNETLLNSLKIKGLDPEDITDVLLTHLHFDHVGGAAQRLGDGSIVPTFPKATYWSNQVHYDWAIQPNAREKASFLKENFVPLHEAGILQFIDIQQDILFDSNIRLRFTYGHTEAMMLPHLQVGDKTVVYCADTLPSSTHLGAPYVMSYDIRPLVSLEEKENLLQEAAEKGWILIFEHDPRYECATVKRNANGRIELDKVGKLVDFLI